MDDQQLRTWLRQLKGKGGIFEVARETVFRAHRERSDGGDEEIRVRVYDAGPDKAPDQRYHIVAESVDGKRRATGNPAGSPSEAAAIVHWGDLDRVR